MVSPNEQNPQVMGRMWDPLSLIATVPSEGGDVPHWYKLFMFQNFSTRHRGRRVGNVDIYKPGAQQKIGCVHISAGMKPYF